jgi:hypothetical protein
VRAYVYECPGGKPFVSHLERFTPEARKAMQASADSMRAGKGPVRGAAQAAPMAGMEVKKPGDKQWVAAANFAKSGPIMVVKCPDGSGEPELVTP